jgi:hypothetical protein
MDKNHMKWLRSRVGKDLVFSPPVAAVIHDVGGRLLLQEKTAVRQSAQPIEPASLAPRKAQKNTESRARPCRRKTP